ncbi:response regulator transcription factor [Gracilibacillus phocaeensis]|uniref:response regulator transcription factor n=1 Tax=Gracilibacillus phocaeensis TaxID=2042304 RepID=UPI001031267B|nr:response regulator [Gracilibacillus phocaeensis]
MARKVILVVDDEPRSRNGIKKTVEKAAIDSFEVITAANAQEAINLMSEQKVHILITDIRMPEISGLELLQQLREKTQEPVVIIISAYSEFDYAHQALQFGVVNYLLKPISKDKLMEAIHKAAFIEEEREQSGVTERIVDKKWMETRKDNQYNRAVKEALDYIEVHYSEELTLKKVAQEVHLNASYLSGLFKEEINMTFSEYVTRRRIQEAKKLLLLTDLTNTEIAEQIGYQTSKYFIKLFKQYENVTPHVYRKQNESDS